MPSWGGIAVRIVAALLGGYLLGALASVAGLALPVAATEAVLGGTLLSFAIFAVAVLVAFAWRSGRGLRQSMAGLPTWAGLLAGWVLYAMFLTGTLSYFRAEISAWMRPELPYRAQPIDAAEAAQRIVDTLNARAIGSPQWSIGLPDARNRVSNVFWRVPLTDGGSRFDSANFDPVMGDELKARETGGGQFFYVFHFQLHYMPALWGRWIAGLCAMLMLVAILSGVITHRRIFVDFFKFRLGKGQRSWLDAHNAMAVWGLPFHLLITYSGLVTLMLMYMPWGSLAAFPTPATRQALTAEMGTLVPPGRPEGRAVPMASVAPMVAQAMERWGGDGVGRLIVHHPGDAQARVIVVRGDAGRVSASPQYLLFDGTNGELLGGKEVVGPAAQTRGVLYALHLGRFAGPVVRWTYFVFSLAGTAMVGTGLVLWTVKRRTRLRPGVRPSLGLRLGDRLNVASLAGLSVAIASFFLGNRLLPAGLGSRAQWEVDVFFIAWAVAALWCVARPVRRGWCELLALASMLLALVPVVNSVSTDRGMLVSLADGDWVFAGFDLACWGFAALHGLAAWHVRPVARFPGRLS